MNKCELESALLGRKGEVRGYSLGSSWMSRQVSRLVTKQLVNFPETRKDEEQDAAWLMEGRGSERREIQGRRVETMGAPTLWGAEVSQVRGLTVCAADSQLLRDMGRPMRSVLAQDGNYPPHSCSVMALLSRTLTALLPFHRHPHNASYLVTLLRKRSTSE